MLIDGLLQKPDGFVAVLVVIGVMLHLQMRRQLCDVAVRRTLYCQAGDRGFQRQTGFKNLTRLFGRGRGDKCATI